MTAVLTGWLVAVLGVVLGAGGIRLVALGGSPAYVVLGLALMVTGAILVRRRIVGLLLYAATLAARGNSIFCSAAVTTGSARAATMSASSRMKIVA